MLQSKLFTKTLKEAPKDEVSLNAIYLTRAGYIDKVTAGVYTYLPLGLRVLNRIAGIIREEIDAVGGQEVLMPAINPKELWTQTGRWQGMAEVLFKFKGVGDKEFTLGPSHEEVVTPLVKKYASSYKDLPAAVYQIQDKFRNEPRAKSGLLRGREFIMKDLYSFHASEADLESYYARVKDAYLKIFARCGLEALVVEASGGFFSKYSHEFQVVTPFGEDKIFFCPNCRHYQNREIATGKPNQPEGGMEPEKPLNEVEAQREASIAASVKLMKIPAWKVLKNIIYQTKNGLLGVTIRGDLNVNEVKLKAYLEDYSLRPANDEELAHAGLVPGFISPVNNQKIKFIGDLSVATVNNYVTGANIKYQDYINVNLNRDFQLGSLADLADINEDYACPKCGAKIESVKAIEVGNIFKLKTKFSEAFDYKFVDADGKLKPVLMGCYGIGLGRLMGTIAEVHHDQQGLIWPKSVAPFAAHLIQVGDDLAVAKKAKAVYDKLLAAGVGVLFDERNQFTPGQKFADADLIGIPYRLVISAKTGTKIEVKKRGDVKSELVDVKKLISLLTA